MVWNADCDCKLARRFICLRGIMVLGLASQELNLAPVLFNNMAHDGQSKAAVALGATGIIEALKRLQSSFPTCGWNAYALVPNLDLH